MKRSPMKRSLPPPRKPAKVIIEYTPRARTPAKAVLAVDGKARMVVMPKYPYLRDERLRDMCRALPCQHCGASGEAAGVTWAHSNQGEHGKGRGIKASDLYVAALCAVCHHEVDQGKASKATRLFVWERAHQRTVSEALRLGLWPEDIQPPTLA